MRRVLALVAFLFVLASAVPAGAHPLGNFTINHLTKVRVGASDVTIRYVLDIAEIPTFQIMHARGIDGPDRQALLDRWASDEVAIIQPSLSRHARRNRAPPPSRSAACLDSPRCRRIADAVLGR